MWSVYDTFLLLAGIITAAIAVIPIPAIPTKTRAVAGAIGGGLILLSLFLGSLTSFTYPALVFAAPIIALIAGGVIVKSALDTQKQRDAVAAGADHGPLQYGQAGHAATPPAAPAPVPVPPASLQAVPVPPAPIPVYAAAPPPPPPAPSFAAPPPPPPAPSFAETPVVPAAAAAASVIPALDLESTRLSAPLANATWVVELPDGRRMPVAGALSFGRDPIADAAAPNTVLIPVDDPQKSMSKTHARIDLIAGEVFVTDLHSTNGTAVREPGSPATSLAPGVAKRLTGTADVQFGDYVITVRSTGA